MSNEKCDLLHPKGVKEKKLEVIDGYTMKHHANGTKQIISYDIMYMVLFFKEDKNI